VADCIDSWQALAATTVEACESATRALTEAERELARAIEIEPLRTLLNASADMTRDLTAILASRIRWLLDC
jgi:hypothetical protein